MQKKCQVIALPTDDNDGIITVDEFGDFESQHLYILSDDKVKKDDWIMYEKSHDIHYIKYVIQNCIYTENDDTFNISHKSIKKIIATTNNSLVRNGIRLPNLSKEFLKRYISQSDAIVEYIYEYPMENGMFNYSKEPVLKVKTTSNNTISIYSNKKKYTQQEVDMLLDQNTCMITQLMLDKNKETWCKEDLPIQAIKDCLKYCEEQQIYDKLGNYNDFYYKLKDYQIVI